jgi:hypothetical protein
MAAVSANFSILTRKMPSERCKAKNMNFAKRTQEVIENTGMAEKK